VRDSAGQSNRQIARETCLDRKTVARYTGTAVEAGLGRDREPSDGEIHEVAQRVQSRPVPDRSAEWQEIEPLRERIEKWLTQKRPLRIRKIHVLLVRDHGLKAGYDTLRRYAWSACGRSEARAGAVS
jgi:hypothetical protein